MSSGSRFCGRFERPGVLPQIGVGHAAAVRILRRLRNPEPALVIPVDVHRLVDQRLGGDEGEVELRMDLDLRGGLRRCGRAALDVAQRVTLLVRRQELVDVGPLAGPRDTAQQQRAVVRTVEVLVEVSGDRDEAAVRRLAAFDRALVGPDLRLDVVHADPLAAAGELVGAALRPGVAGAGGLRRVRRGQHMDVGHQIHVVVDLVVHGPVGHVLRDRALAIGEVQLHRAFEPPGRAVAPRAAGDRPEPVRIARDVAGVDGDQAAAAGEELRQILAIGGIRDVARLLRVQDQHVGLVELCLGGKGLGPGRARAARVQQRQPVLQEARMIVGARSVGLRPGPDEHAQLARVAALLLCRAGKW